MTIRREMAEWSATSGYGIRDTSRGIRDITNLASRIPNFESRLSRQPRLSQASAIAAEALMNNAG